MVDRVVVGLGATSSATVDDCLELVRRVVRPEWVVVEVATLAGKEALIGPVADALGVPWSAWTAECLDRVEVPNPPALARGVIGTSSVAEAAALLASKGGRLMLGKVGGRAVTIAVACTAD